MAEVLRFYAEDGEEFFTDNSDEVIADFKKGNGTYTLDDGRTLTGKLIDTETMN